MHYLLTGNSRIFWGRGTAPPQTSPSGEETPLPTIDVKRNQDQHFGLNTLTFCYLHPTSLGALHPNFPYILSYRIQPVRPFLGQAVAWVYRPQHSSRRHVLLPCRPTEFLTQSSATRFAFCAVRTTMCWRSRHVSRALHTFTYDAYSSGQNNNNNNNNVRLLNCWHTAQLTMLTSATQGSTIYRRVKPAKLLPHTAHGDWINRTGLTSWAFTDKVAHYSIYRPRKDERLSWPWLAGYILK